MQHYAKVEKKMWPPTLVSLLSTQTLRQGFRRQADLKRRERITRQAPMHNLISYNLAQKPGIQLHLMQASKRTNNQKRPLIAQRSCGSTYHVRRQVTRHKILSQAWSKDSGNFKRKRRNEAWFKLIVYM
jgi:hypothetical protein